MNVDEKESAVQLWPMAMKSLQVLHMLQECLPESAQQKKIVNL